MHRYLLFFICTVSSQLTGAQSPIWKELTKSYPDESAIFLNRNKVITLQVNGDSVMAMGEMDERILFLKDRPANSDDMRIYGSHFQEIENLKAKTSVWDKTRYKDIPLTDLSRKREDDASVFYDDSYFYHLSFPVAHAGNQASWSYQERYRDARFLSAFYFQDYLPQVKGSFLMRVPKGIEIKWHILNDPEKRIQFKQYEKGSFTHYEWTVANMPAFKSEENSPKFSYFIPLVVFHVASWNDEQVTKPLLSNLTDLHAWYYQTIKAIDEEPTPELTGAVKQLLQPGDKEIDIVRKVFYWVQDNIRYIAFEDGMRGLIPHKPSYVFEKRYGDCKDMASLIVGMLKAVGVKSYYTWIGTRDIPYQYSFIPSPLVDNHMIATYIDSNQNHFFLDGTSNHTSLSLPSAMIQGKEAFISLGATQYEVKRVPEISALQNLKKDSVLLTIDGGSLMGKGKVDYSGYLKINASYDFNNTVAIKQKENVMVWVNKGSNKFFLNSYAIHHMNDKDTPLRVDYDFRVNDYVTSAGDEIYVNLNLEKTFYNQIITSTRKVPIEYDYRFAVDNTYVLTIPAGYEVEFLPPNAHLEEGIINFDLSYHQSESSITLVSKLEQNSLLLTPDKFDTWNKAIKALSAAYKESIIFKKKSP